MGKEEAKKDQEELKGTEGPGGRSGPIPWFEYPYSPLG